MSTEQVIFKTNRQHQCRPDSDKPATNLQRTSDQSALGNNVLGNRSSQMDREANTPASDPDRVPTSRIHCI